MNSGLSRSTVILLRAEDDEQRGHVRVHDFRMD